MLVQGTCDNCSGQLEFKSSEAGTTVICPHCGTATLLHIPDDLPRVLQSVEATPPKSRTWIILVSASGMLLVAGLVLWFTVVGPWMRKNAELERQIQSANEDKEARRQQAEMEKQLREQRRLDRFRGEAQARLRGECTNQVVGISRIIRSNIADSDPDPANWKGDATVEFVNHVGGIERTNLVFRFSVIMPKTGGRDYIECAVVNQK